MITSKKNKEPENPIPTKKKAIKPVITSEMNMKGISVIINMNMDIIKPFFIPVLRETYPHKKIKPAAEINATPNKRANNTDSPSPIPKTKLP